MTMRPTVEFAPDFIAAIDVAPKTTITYTQGLHAFAEYLNSHQATPQSVVPLAQLREDSLAQFRHWLRNERGYNRRTENTYLAAAVRFMQWLDAHTHLPEGLQSNRMTMLLRETSGRRRVGYKTQPIKDGVLQVIEHYDSQPLPAADQPRPRRQRLTLLRNRAMVHTLFATGLRAQELASLRRSDLADEHNKILITGKGEKERQVMLNDEARAAIQTYLQERDAQARRPTTSAPRTRAKPKHNSTPSAEPLFVRHDRDTPTRITTKTVWQVVSDAARALGLKDPVSPHDFRRYIATAMLSEGMPLESVQEFLGHESIVTTRTVYARTWSEVLEDQVKTYRPSPKRK